MCLSLTFNATNGKNKVQSTLLETEPLDFLFVNSCFQSIIVSSIKWCLAMKESIYASYASLLVGVLSTRKNGFGRFGNNFCKEMQHHQVHVPLLF